MIAWFAGQKLTLFALGMLGTLCFCLCLWWLRKYLEWQNVQILDIKERVGLKIEFVKTAAQIVGGLFFILTILVAYWNYQVSQKNLEATQKKNEADLEQGKEKQVTELYVKAIGQLGSDKLPVILGGIYALERIARDSEKDKGPILEVLTAYVRQNAPWPPENPAQARKRRPWTKKGRKVAIRAIEGKSGANQPEKGKGGKEKENRPEPDTDIQAMLTVIGRLGPARDDQGKPQRLDLARTDLRGADLREAHLERARLGGAHLDGANLREAHLEGADLIKAHLKGTNLMTNLVGAHLERAYLGFAHLEGAALVGAHLERAHLDGSHLEGAELSNAHLERAGLVSAHLERAFLLGAYLDGAVISGAWLKGACLQGADFRGSIGLAQMQIDQAYCDDWTQLPPVLKCPEKKKPSP
jgi:hypothetical protein